MSLFKDFDDMVAEIRKQRDSLISDIEEITNRYREKETKIQGAFGGVLLNEKTERMEKEKECEIKKAILYFQGSTMSLIDRIRTKIDLFVKMSNFDNMDDLKRFEGLPLTPQEFSYLVQRYGHNKNYWNERMLYKIACDNDISFSTCPSVDVMFGVVEDLQEQIKALTECVENGEAPLKGILTDDYLSELFKRFMGVVSQEGR